MVRVNPHCMLNKMGRILQPWIQCLFSSLSSSVSFDLLHVLWSRRIAALDATQTTHTSKTVLQATTTFEVELHAKVETSPDRLRSIRADVSYIAVELNFQTFEPCAASCRIGGRNRFPWPYTESTPDNADIDRVHFTHFLSLSPPWYMPSKIRVTILM
jgi:hypothetical protein